jgi:hypothetical protein
MQMPQATDAHRRMQVLAGTWVGEERIHPSPVDPAGGTARARVRNVTSLDGFAVVQDYEQERGGRVNFRGHGVFRFDAGRAQYVLHWFDSFGQPPAEFWGTFDGDVLTLTSRGPLGHVRARWDVAEPGRYAYQMDVSPDGAQCMRFIDGTYRRVEE